MPSIRNTVFVDIAEKKLFALIKKFAFYKVEKKCYTLSLKMGWIIDYLNYFR